MLNNGCNDFLFGVHCVEEGDRILPLQSYGLDRRWNRKKNCFSGVPGDDCGASANILDYYYYYKYCLTFSQLHYAACAIWTRTKEAFEPVRHERLRWIIKQCCWCGLSSSVIQDAIVRRCIMTEPLSIRYPLMESCYSGPSWTWPAYVMCKKNPTMHGWSYFRLASYALFITWPFAWPFSVFTQKQVSGPRTAKSQRIWIKFCTHLLLYEIHLWADFRDRHLGGSMPNQNDYVFWNTCNAP